MKRLSIILATIVLAGAGCFGGQTSSSATDGGVFISTNAGVDWVQSVAVPSPKGVGTLNATNIVAMEMDPQDHTVVYIGTRENGMLFTLDAGASWQQPRLAALKEGQISAIDVDPKDVCTAYVAKGPRVYKTTDCGRSFDAETYLDSRTGVNVNVIAVDWFNPQVVWLGLSNGDILKSEDAGNTWSSKTAVKNEIRAIIINNTDSRIVLVGTKGDGFQKTIDGGATWVQIEKELKEFKNGNKVTALVQDAASTTVVAATEYGLLRSKDYGATWEAISLVTQPGQVDIKAVAMDPNDANRLYYAAGSTFYSTTVGDAPWDTSKIQSTRLPQVLIVDPTDSNLLYMGVASAEKK